MTDADRALAAAARALLRALAARPEDYTLAPPPPEDHETGD